MPRTFIVSEETLRELVEAYASLSAWYHELSRAVRQPGATVTEPGVEQRAAYVAELGGRYPEIAELARTLTAPRPYVPPPIFVPVVALAPEAQERPAGLPPSSVPPAPPPLVDPAKVKY